MITVEKGVEILRELARTEPFQYNHGRFDPEYREYTDAVEAWKKAKKHSPIAMLRAKVVFLADKFCHYCGACLPKRDGEGTCMQCDPQGVLQNWVRNKIEIAAAMPGPVDCYDYQRAQGQLDVLHELEEMLDE